MDNQQETPRETRMGFRLALHNQLPLDLVMFPAKRVHDGFGDGKLEIVFQHPVRSQVMIFQAANLLIDRKKS